MEIVKIKYHYNPDVLGYIEKIGVGDWIDLRSAHYHKIKKGESLKLSLGISAELPSGYEAIIAPRSSLFFRHGLLVVNSIGIIDNSYCGNNDIWRLPVYAFEDTEILEGERIAQFRIVKSQPTIEFSIVDELSNNDRGGFGSTGGYHERS